MSALLTAVLMTALCGFVSLGVDLGRVQLAKSELQTAADAAVRAAANSFSGGVSAAQQAAQGAAGDNTCDGVPVSLAPATDLAFGSWNPTTKTFVPAAPGQEDSATALKVSLRRSAANGIPLLFGAVLGKSTCNISATSIATVETNNQTPVGFVGLDHITHANNTVYCSYKSFHTTNPSQTSDSSAMVQSNGEITFKKNASVLGGIQLGPDGLVSGSVNRTGSLTKLQSPITAPLLPAWNPSPNPNGVPQNFSVNGYRMLPGGTYWLTSLDVNGILAFSGPATVYVNGDINIDGIVLADQLTPSRLKIYQLGDGRKFGDSGSNGSAITAEVVAPGAALEYKNNLLFYGSGVFKTITTKNNAVFFYDESLSGPVGSGSKTISMVK